MKIIVMVVCLFLLVSTKIFSQIKPSFYAGVGTFTNLGSLCGIGTEIKHNWVSFNIAAGPGIIAEHIFLYDVGVKLYSKYKFFGGINYGFVRGETIFNKKDYYGFTFSAGYKRNIYKHFYGMGYLGATSDYLSFIPKEKRKYALIPRIGFIIGYEF
jgi:hypothetical protein